ncbi:cytochrome P450 4c3-like [Malaya genurostris]|uniref:cytochrome P450 4c3-like n=1 Tax=Malaya genurostris TaxID=325434 RepID=UPI0026F3CA79|nr:cytochrome P450 4c3-like [Malaya genurostris]
MEKSLLLIFPFYQIVNLVKEFHLLTVVICAIVYIATINKKAKSAAPVKNQLTAEKVKQHVNKLPGPACLPLLGNALLMATDREEMFNRLIAARKLYGRKQGLNRIWNGSVPYIIVSKATVVERILSSSVNIEKGRDYNFLRPWLGDGLLTCPASKWYHRRKALNPTFNYKMLTEFLEVFNQQATTMVRVLEKELGNYDGFDCTRYATLYSLDVLCETAMGCSIHAQKQFESEYVKAHEQIGRIMLDRLQNIWLHPDCIFKFTNNYKRQMECLKVLHRFSEQVITHRRRLQQNVSQNETAKDTTSEINQKRHLAFLDLLLDIKQNGVPLTDREIRDEVDTFILGGHDTTATAIGWLMYLLGTNQHIQDRLFEEIDAVMGQDRDRPPTMSELNEMKYLDCCIKEALRLYPSIPIIARRLTESVRVDEYTIPASANAIIVLYQLHRDPEMFTNPEKFDPDRFLPENVKSRHQYAYIPFSGGPRNCIGQKFGLLEEKSVFTTILRKYRIVSLDRREDLTLYGELVLKSKNGLKINISRRD